VDFVPCRRRLEIGKDSNISAHILSLTEDGLERSKARAGPHLPPADQPMGVRDRPRLLPKIRSKAYSTS
jgi:hypothetical protein